MPEFARQAGIQILAPAASIRGIVLPSIKGTYDVREALRLLLAKTNLEIATDDGQIITLHVVEKAVVPDLRKPTRLPQTVHPAERIKSPPQSLPIESLQETEVIVTGTRIIRDGYEAPTPLTVLSIEQVQSQATFNIADFLNTLPALAGSQTASTNIVPNGTGGINALNLRDLGTQRTLILLDGQRSVGSTVTGVVDINNLPQQLISRVDVVTGGASASYGSDALAGVINFVLDKTFTGMKGEVSGGVTGYGDDRSYKISLTGGTGFANERGHLLLSGEISHVDGVIDPVNRAWNHEGWLVMLNPNYTPTNGQPQRLVLNPVINELATGGGLITSGPLKGIAFGPGGQPYNFDYGLLQDGINVYGSSQANTQGVHFVESLGSRESRQNIFTRLSYDIGENVNAYAQFSWGHATSFAKGLLTQYDGNLTVKIDNAFIPASVAARGLSLGVTQFSFGTYLMDTGYGTPYIFGDRTTNRNVIGANGQFDAFGANWRWDAYAQIGITRQSSKLLGNVNNFNFSSAIDAVLGPNGQIVCRSSLTSPNNGCVPYNLFGEGVNSQAAIDYILGTTQRNERFEQDVGAATLHGEPLSIWAGPVSFALGVEHRREAVRGSSDIISQTTGYRVGNYRPTIGSYAVTEGFIETVVPLAKDEILARSLDFNAAVRFTNYSTAGYVTTWKSGATYTPFNDIKFRITRSRDIRAPNLSDLFAGGTSGINSVLDPFNGNTAITVHSLNTGNINLKPEKADTTGVGVVLQPRFASGFSASVDYWNIDVNGIIGTVPTQTIVNNCYQGALVYCAAFARRDGQLYINIYSFNIARAIVRGVDYEASYRVNAADIVSGWDGNFTVRVLATNYLKNYLNDTINRPTDIAGQNFGGAQSITVPRWRWTTSIEYESKPFSLSVTARGFSAGTIDNTFIECSSACPPATIDHPTVNINRIGGAAYLDMGSAYEFADGMTAFFNVKNITDRNPPPYLAGPAGLTYSNALANLTMNDIFGRMFRAGIRFKM